MLVRSFASLALVFGLSLAPAAYAADDKPDTPTSLKGGKVVSVDEAKGLLDKKGAIFLDTRAAINFGKGHVPGASIVAYKEKSEFKADFDASQDAFDLGKLPADKNAKIVFYSDSPQGWKSYKASIAAIAGGYKNVSWMRDGFSAWVGKALPVEQ